jgi:hypothetical protein
MRGWLQRNGTVVLAVYMAMGIIILTIMVWVSNTP